MINITKYLNRYHNEEELFTVYEFSEELVYGKMSIKLGIETLDVEYDDKGFLINLSVTSGNLRDIPNNDFLFSINERGLHFINIHNLPTYKLKHIKSKCIIKHNDSNTFYFF